MRVLQICSYYINDALYANFFRELNKVGVYNKAYVFANKNRAKDGKKFEDTTVSYCFNSFDRIFFHRKHRKVFWDFDEKFDMTGFDCVHAHSLFSNGYIAYRIKKKYGIPYIVTVRYPDVFTFFKWMVHLRPLGEHILQEAAEVIFLSKSTMLSMKKYVKADIWKMVENKAHIIPNGIDEFWLDNKPAVLQNSRREGLLRLLFVGRINRNKNPEVLIRICEILKSRGVPVELKLVGTVEDKKYKDIFASYDFVKYYSKCEKEDLLEHYRSADVFVMLSHKETFGLVYAEAISQGLPILYTRGQGFDGQFEEGVVGYSCSSSKPEEAVILVEKILEEYSSMSERCIVASEKFSWKDIVLEIKKLYKSIENKP